jgi:hypothetical protein
LSFSHHGSSATKEAARSTTAEIALGSASKVCNLGEGRPPKTTAFAVVSQEAAGKMFNVSIDVFGRGEKKRSMPKVN